MYYYLGMKIIHVRCVFCSLGKKLEKYSFWILVSELVWFDRVKRCHNLIITNVFFYIIKFDYNACELISHFFYGLDAKILFSVMKEI